GGGGGREEVAPDAAPGRPLGPRHAGVEALDRRVPDLVAGKAGIEDHDVGIGVADGRLAAPVALVRPRGGRSQDRRRGGGRRGPEEGTAVECAPRVRPEAHLPGGSGAACMGGGAGCERAPPPGAGGGTAACHAGGTAVSISKMIVTTE